MSDHKWLNFAVGLGLIAFGGGAVIHAFTASVVLSDDSIRQGSVFRHQSMRFDQIRYRREYMEYKDAVDGGINVYYLELVSRESDVPSLKIVKDDFDFDRAFWDWVYRIPDLDRI